VGKASAQAYGSLAITIKTAEALQKAYESHFSELEVKEHQFNVDAELESAQGQVVISNLVLDLTSQLFNALGASASSQGNNSTVSGVMLERCLHIIHLFIKKR
jgi:hypothetical protein